MVENDGFNNGPFPLKLKIEITDENMVCDFTGTHEQLKDTLNLSRTGLETAVERLSKPLQLLLCQPMDRFPM
jgi:N-methylhydantoinase B